MSRLTATHNNGNHVAYGLDHACGWFYMETNSKDDIVEDLNTIFTGLSKGDLIDLLNNTDAPKEVKFRIALDLDPQE